LLSQDIFAVSLQRLVGSERFHAMAFGQVAPINADVRTILSGKIFPTKSRWLYKVLSIVNVVRVPHQF
jgi:hypothetical protein